MCARPPAIRGCETWSAGVSPASAAERTSRLDLARGSPHRASRWLRVLAIATFAATVTEAIGGGRAFAQPAADTSAVEASYKRHMSIGVKLFQDQNYEAAIVEFDAAYRAKPKASPLVNIALCQKALFRYPKAITTLEMAVSKHGETLSDADRKAT